jgi:DNA-binding protein HU-beta
MNKTEFAQKLAKKAGVSQAKALEIVDIIFSAKSGEGIIAVELDAGGSVTIPGFGTFGTRSRAAHTARNPANQAVITVPAKKYAFFKAGKTLRERVSE